MATWLSKAVHQEMRAAARDVCKSGGACRVLAWANSLTNMETSLFAGHCAIHPGSIPCETFTVDENLRRVIFQNYWAHCVGITGPVPIKLFLRPQ